MKLFANPSLNTSFALLMSFYRFTETYKTEIEKHKVQGSSQKEIAKHELFSILDDAENQFKNAIIELKQIIETETV